MAGVYPESGQSSPFRSWLRPRRQIGGDQRRNRRRPEIDVVELPPEAAVILERRAARRLLRPVRFSCEPGASRIERSGAGIGTRLGNGWEDLGNERECLGILTCS